MSTVERPRYLFWHRKLSWSGILFKTMQLTFFLIVKAKPPHREPRPCLKVLWAAGITSLSSRASLTHVSVTVVMCRSYPNGISSNSAVLLEVLLAFSKTNHTFPEKCHFLHIISFPWRAGWRLSDHPMWICCHWRAVNRSSGRLCSPARWTGYHEPTIASLFKCSFTMISK